jgi:hypothetical protein
MENILVFPVSKVLFCTGTYLKGGVLQLQGVAKFTPNETK